MTHPNAIRDIAQRIANEHLEDADFCLVYEDEEVADLTGADLDAIYVLVTQAKAVLPGE